MKKTKIIYILPHFPGKIVLNIKDPNDYFKSDKLGFYHKLDYPPYWVGFFKLDHHVLNAETILKMTDEFDIECWRPYGFGLKEIHTEIIDGIVHKVFPGFEINIPHFGHLIWSSSLFHELVKEIYTNNVIVNLSYGHNWFSIILALKLKKHKDKFGLIIIHRSGGFKKVCFKHLPLWKKFLKSYYFLESYIDMSSLKTCDVYYIGALPELEYLKRKQPKVNAIYFNEGVDFSSIKELTKFEKSELREKLNLPKDKIIFIVYGNWNSRDYAYQNILKAYSLIKSSGNNEDLLMLMIGGYKYEDLYHEGIKVGAIMVEKVDKELFINYLQASDFFGQPMLSWVVEFGGLGTSMIEAWACGLPAISSHLIHFPGSSEELKEMGLSYKNFDQLVSAIITMKNNFPNYDKCRIIAKKYFDSHTNNNLLIQKYRELSRKYFSTNKK